MSAQIKINNINTHVVDILGSVTGRDQPVMKMDKAVELVKCLDETVFTNDENVFFDPFCKAGEILLATALVSMLYKSKKNFVRMDTVVKEMYKSNRYFALAPDKRHYNLSLRTFYGNDKSHDSNITENIKNGNYLSEIDGRLDKEKFNKELLAMLEYIKQKTGNKKIIAVGNPPYQEDYKNYKEGKKNNTGNNPIYHIFLNDLIDSKKIDEFSMVLPSRWFAGGRGETLKQFSVKLRKSKKIKQICDFKNSKDVFPTVEIKGGVCFLHWSKKYNGKTLFYNYTNQEQDMIDVSKDPIIIRDKISRSIYKKNTEKMSKVYIRDSMVLEFFWIT